MKKIYWLILLAFIPSFCLAKETLTGGTLQAYWSTKDWSTDVIPHMGFRYLTSDQDKFIAIQVKGDKKKFIKKHFKNIPDNFFKHKEWYVNQQGDLTVDKVVESVMCNSDIYDATLISFKPDFKASSVDTSKYEDTARGGCNIDGRLPYITIYIGKSDQQKAAIKSAPDDKSDTLWEIGKTGAVVKLKTINKNWLYVAKYDYSQPELASPEHGYVRIKQVKIID